MKATPGAFEALRKNPERAVTVVMTDELREKHRAIGREIIHMLLSKTDGPVEARIVLQFVVNAFDSAFDCKGVIIGERSDEEH